MKKILALCILSIVLTSCSSVYKSYNSLINKMYTSDDDKVAVNPDDSLQNHDQDGELPADQKAESNITLDYKAETNEIDATIITNWNGSPQGTLYLTWTAPKKSTCYSTSFPITKTDDENDQSTDTQSVLSDGKVCEGTWIASVTDKLDNKILSKQKVVIKQSPK